MLPAAHRSSTRLGGRVALFLLVAAALLWALPTLRESSVATTQAAGELTAAPAQADKAATGAKPDTAWKAPQGKWKVVRVEKGKDGDKAWGRILHRAGGLRDLGDWDADPSNTYRFEFHDDGRTLVLHNRLPTTNIIRYSVDLRATPKTIDFYGLVSSRPDTDGRLGLGIYKVEPNRLTICLTASVPGLPSRAQRPTGFSVSPDSADILFVLEPYTPPPELQTVAGTWEIAKEIRDGEAVSHAGPPAFRRWTIWSDLVTMDDQRTVRFVLNATTQPNEITWSGWEGVNEKITEHHFNGIYKRDGDRLTIAYRKNGPRPEKFESPRGSGVTLLELDRVSPVSSQRPARTKTGESEVPPNPAKTETMADGKAEQTRKTAVPAASSAWKALQGEWKVVQVETGKDADRAWGRILQWRRGGRGDWDADPSNTYRFDFRAIGGGSLMVDSRLPPTMFLRPRIDSGATPKTIDFYRTSGNFTELLGSGIYEVGPDRLKICVAANLTGMNEKALRPTAFSASPDSGNILFVLERYSPPPELQTVAGRWEIATQIRDGEAVSHTGPAIYRRWAFFGDMVTMNDDRRGRFVLNATTQPKEITWFGWEGVNEKMAEQHYNGIYKLDGDRLTIAYRKNGPRPEKFESPRGSGVTLLELDRLKPTTTPKPDDTKTGKSQAPRRQAKIPTITPDKEAATREQAIAELKKAGAYLEFRRDRGDQVLKVMLNPGVGDEVLSWIACLSETTYVELNGTRVSNAGLARLGPLGDLQGLSLAETGITDAGIEYIREHKTLRSLNLTKTKVSDAGLARLSPLRDLKMLLVKDTGITDAGVKHIAEHRGMSYLDLAGTKITDAGLAELSPLEKLVYLMVTETGITDAGVKHICRHKSLWHLNLGGTKITDDAIPDLAKLPQLADLMITGIPPTQITDRALERLTPLKSLKRLYLNGTRVRMPIDDHGGILYEAIRTINEGLRRFLGILEALW